MKGLLLKENKSIEIESLQLFTNHKNYAER